MYKMIKAMALVFAVIFFSSSVFAQTYRYDLESIKKRSQKQIELIQKKLKEQATAKEIQDTFGKAEGLYREGEFQKAKELYEKAYNLSNDKSMRDYIKRADKEMAEQRRKEREEQSRLQAEQRDKERLEIERRKEAERQRKEKINSLYKEARSLYKQDRLDKARAVFLQILSLEPDHRGARKYLETKIPRRIKKIQEAEERERRRRSSSGG